jgi:hypothetical protein
MKVVDVPFMKADLLNSLPSKHGLLDWDCAGSLDVDGMAESLAYIRQHASFPVSGPQRMLSIANRTTCS